MLVHSKEENKNKNKHSVCKYKDNILNHSDTFEENTLANVLL